MKPLTAFVILIIVLVTASFVEAQTFPRPTITIIDGDGKPQVCVVHEGPFGPTLVCS